MSDEQVCRYNTLDGGAEGMNVIIENENVTVKIEMHGDPIHWPAIDIVIDMLEAALKAHYPHVKSLKAVI